MGENVMTVCTCGAEPVVTDEVLLACHEAMALALRALTR